MRGTAERIDDQKIQAALVAALPLDVERAPVACPVDARQVDVRLSAKVHRHRAAPVEHLDEQFDLGVGGPRFGEALDRKSRAAGVRFDPRHLADFTFVDAGVGERTAIRPPPMTGVAGELLLRDELRGAIGNADSPFRGHALGTTAPRVARPERTIVQICEQAPVRRGVDVDGRRRQDLTRLRRCGIDTKQAGRGAGEQVAECIPFGFQDAARGDPLPLQPGLTSCVHDSRIASGQQHPRFGATGGAHRPEVQDGAVRRSGTQVRDCRTVWRDADRPD